MNQLLQLVKPAVAPNMDDKKPTLASQAPTSQITSLRTDLSFILPTSLAAFPNLSWLQTPWSPSFPPLSQSHASAIANNLCLPASSFENALPFCSTPSHGPDLFIIFPRSTTNPSTNERVLSILHDKIIKPAFDRAWHDSHQASSTGAYRDAVMRILPATGVHTPMDAHPFAGFLARLRNNASGSVSAAWPSGNAQVLSEAWAAITGMVNGYPDLKEFQHPLLVAVQRDEICFGEQMGVMAVYEEMGKEWDAWVDAEHVVEGSLRVVMEIVVGVTKEEMGEEIGIGREFKRMAEGEEGEGQEMEGADEDEDGHRAKRRKVGGEE